jgi:copper(I)-binding protein
MKKLITAAVLATCLPIGALAAGMADQITVVDPQVRMVPPGAMATAAFMTLKNGSDKDAKLIKADNSVSKVTELHTHLNEDGVMKMRQVPAIEIKARSETQLEPGGLHIMMIDLKGPLKEGAKVGLTLGFEDGSSKQVEAVVRKPMPMPAMDHSKHMQH